MIGPYDLQIAATAAVNDQVWQRWHLIAPCKASIRMLFKWQKIGSRLNSAD